jgi:hypothetical protein
MTKSTKTLLAALGALCLLGIGSASAFAESTNKWSPVKTVVTAESTNSSFTAASTTDECAKFALKGTTPAGNGKEFSEEEAQKGVNATPTVEKCNFGTTVTGPWVISFHSTGCAGTKGEEDEDDCLTVKIPNEGAKVNFVICTVKVKANTITAPYDDEAGTVEFKELPVAVEGCGVTSAKFKGKFTLTPRIVDGE